ncbi:hypothetical protein LNQ49_04825 [Flavobacterium sp. F-65]|uniref:PRTase-CE domain-containing protein n=1 Tax=Flavobacterium pisciphilum TaxID=2893755 RepID=A0ABS8MSQ7_9FLAO|nr:hypothetical protein [Flavobacterium sp. F-65]MCC9070920.1 hypothetical protein [Flavobacterium sp. F-65]
MSNNTRSPKLPLPSEADLINQIRLTSEIVWEKKLDKSHITEWLTNFKGEVFKKSYEDQLALWLLANFVFYNENEVKHLCKMLYSDFIHKLIVEQDVANSIDLNYKKILGRSRFYSLGQPGESSSYILYLFRQQNEIPLKKFISRLDNLDQTVDTIIFVDDVTLSTGEKSQAAKYIRQLKQNNPSLKNKRILLLTFIATDDAIDYLQSENIEVVTCIILDKRHKCFEEDSMVFSYFNEHLENAKKFATHYGNIVKPANPLGHNDGQFLFGFYYNTPDNTLPIFWAEENNWIPIRKRYHKNYQNKLLNIGKYI